MITPLGEMSIAAAVPAAASASVAGAAGINTGSAALQAELDGLIEFPVPPMPLTAQLAIAESIVTGLTAAIALGIPPADMSADILARIAVLTGQLAALSAQLGICVDLGSALATPGLRLYAYAGPVAAFGGELALELGTDPTPSNALVLLTTDAACWASMSAIFKVSA